jgi:hypothetical protein
MHNAINLWQCLHQRLPLVSLRELISTPLQRFSSDVQSRLQLQRPRKMFFC